MINIQDAKRLVKRALLANITTAKKDLAITPLVSGKHGIGKSQMIKSIAEDLGGVCITIEGGTLKEGEITGIPYQYKDEAGNISFRFLPYYAVERIQNEEKRLFLANGKTLPERLALIGDQNAYAANDLSPEEKIQALLEHKVQPVILFIDEINRTENTVYKELMNILLTRSVNGYEFPWWVFFVGAMNPSTQTSLYATNEMDPAQLDRFLKLKVSESAEPWLKFAKDTGIDENIIAFIKENPKCLSEQSKELEDEEKPTPSPRGWDMVDTLLKSEPMLRPFFNEKENEKNCVDKDMKALLSAKLGVTVATMYFAALKSNHAITPAELLNDDEDLSKNGPRVEKMSAAKKSQSADLLLGYLKDNAEFVMIDDEGFAKLKRQVQAFVKLLDSSTQLLFAQKIISANTDSGTPLINLFYDAFSDEILAKLSLSEQTRKIIMAGKK